METTIKILICVALCLIIIRCAVWCCIYVLNYLNGRRNDDSKLFGKTAAEIVEKLIEKKQRYSDVFLHKEDCSVPISKFELPFLYKEILRQVRVRGFKDILITKYPLHECGEYYYSIMIL